MPKYQLVLASTSPYRQQILTKLDLPFITASPDCDETPLVNEAPQALVARLAEAKARSCRLSRPSLVIGSDQVCVIDGQIVGKPHTREKAIAQLTRQSGKTITFYTGLALHNTHSGYTEVAVEPFHVHFRSLTQQQIEAYVDKEMPLNCAGSFKSEGLGIALFDRLEGRDPNTLIGLPLITLIDMLERQHVPVFGEG
ncbi:Maf family protein [Vibrio proteolyticus]|uniref:7-methyl-GTP pyrophosphatase n=1 Tax=Vibrio proteolyticus NBRC 13287 TaxID=1219065 RepID=U2ZZ11_VIBPR|nr:nucleoside triphosphate pyrophosphatase [Vibrio proteolyticus]GAD66307.1 putative Maf-like protein [Vibrio proteolyticus NBRC 13287]